MSPKRKRSDPEPQLCSSPASSSSLLPSSPPSHRRPSSWDMPPANTAPSAAPFHSRTRKRYRDNRPSEEQVHQHTLKLLYSAQREHPRDAHHDTSARRLDSRPTAPPSAHQRSLHHFWRIPGAPAASPGDNVEPLLTPPCACEDCGAGLRGLDGDSFPAGPTACVACGKHVCFGCSASNLGEERRCLRCAGSRVSGVGVRVGMGGLGWNDAGMSIC